MSTKIEWADLTINPIVGCSKCSPGCDNCYAERFAARMAKHPNPKISGKYAGVVDAQGKWTGKIANAQGDKAIPHRAPGKNKRSFVGSMTDLFHPGVDRDILDGIFASILYDAIVTNGHGHTYIMLTKRVDRMLEYFSPGPETLLRRWGEAGNGWLHVDGGDETFSEYAEGQTIPQPGHEKHPNLLHEFLWPLPNLWLLVTICNQAEADAKIPLLLRTPAAKRGVSVEPMLGPVNFHLEDVTGQVWDTLKGGITAESSGLGIATGYQKTPGLDWVICGGETGPRARPMHPDWVRGLRDQCNAAGVPFFFKGWGEWGPLTDDIKTQRYATGPKQINMDYLNPLGKWMFRVGKRRAGRLLDGREWNEVPS